MVHHVTFLSLALAMMAPIALAELNCLPEQFTATEQELRKRDWYRNTFDFKNQRKLGQDLSTGEFYYVDLQNKTTSHFTTDGECHTRPLRYWTIVEHCAGSNTIWDPKAGRVVGESESVNSFLISSDKAQGVVTVSLDKWYPITASLTDMASGLSLYITYADIVEEIDPDLFPTADELAKCTPANWTY